MSTDSGIDALAAIFARAAAEGRAAFLPYFPVGYPSYTDSIEIILALAAAGADAIEIGIPFSDPLADGPTIQAAAQVALANGITVRRCLEAVSDLRARGLRVPVILMGYLNPLLAYGLDAFVQDAHRAGVDGLIVPDLPPEEAGPLGLACAREGLALIFLLAPTSSLDRIALVTARSTGFVYLVSVTGVTGARDGLPPDLAEFVARVRARTTQPLALGFGISRPDQARAVAALADGVIVGSAIVKAATGGVLAARELAASLRHAVERP